jgi:hypothetical protein
VKGTIYRIIPEDLTAVTEFEISDPRISMHSAEKTREKGFHIH